MATIDPEMRDRVKALVRQVLESVPHDERTHSENADQVYPTHVLVRSMAASREREYDRDESSKSLITEDDLRGLETGARLVISEGARFTALANDIVNDKQIILIKKEGRESKLKVSSAAIGADHGGFQLKEKLSAFLSDLGVRVRDFGTDSEDAVDYPDIAHAVASAVGSGHVDVGIIVDGAGIGSAIAANKVPGVRAAACYSEALASNSREHNGANVITLGSGQTSFEDAKAILTRFLSTEISEERHKRRVAKITDIDRQYRR